MIKKGKNFILYRDDNLKIIPKLDYSNSIIITSPPYNFCRNYDKYNDNKKYDEFLYFLYKRFDELYKYCNDDTRLIVILKDDFVNFRFLNFDFYNLMNDIGWKFYAYYVIESSHVSKFTAWGSWCSASAPRVRVNFEMAQIYYKKYFKRSKKDKISTISKEEFMEYTLSLIKGDDLFSKEINKKEHPAQFSPYLIDRFVKLFSFKEDTVIDIFCGVGNAGISALRNGRKFIGIDISEQYIDIAYKKLIKIENRLF